MEDDIIRHLALLDKMLAMIHRQMRIHPDKELLNDKQLDILEIITRMYHQQKSNFKIGESRESIQNRILSVSKPHIRLIIPRL